MCVNALWPATHWPASSHTPAHTQVLSPAAEYKFDSAERAVEMLEETHGTVWRQLQNLLFQNCFCLLVSSGRPAAEKLESGKVDPVPPIREMQLLALSRHAGKRGGQGKSKLPEEVMYELCQISEQTRPSEERTPGSPKPNHRANDICVNVTFEYAGTNVTWNPCTLTWELRALEESLAMCVSSLYLTDTPVTIEDVSGRFTGHDNLVPGDDVYSCEQVDPQARAVFCRESKKSAPGQSGGGAGGEPYKSASQIKAEQEAAAAAAAAAEAAKVKRLRSFNYTFSTVSAWWREYSSAPPFNRTDSTRKKLIGYYSTPGCARCGSCRSERLNSHDFQGFRTKSALPVQLAIGQHFWARLVPVEGDFRLDAFAGRYKPMELAFSVVVSASSQADALLARQSLQVCVVSNSTYAKADAETRSSSTGSSQQVLDDFAGPIAFRSLNETKLSPSNFCQDGLEGNVGGQRSGLSFDEATGMYAFSLTGSVPELKKSGKSKASEKLLEN